MYRAFQVHRKVNGSFRSPNINVFSDSAALLTRRGLEHFSEQQIKKHAGGTEAYNPVGLFYFAHPERLWRAIPARLLASCTAAT